MKKSILIFAVLAVLPWFKANAQAKVSEVVTSNYNRNSVSFIAVQRGDSFDKDVLSAVKSFNPGHKFDINKIPTKSFSIRKTRSLSSKNYSSDYTIPLETINRSVVDGNLGREILSYTFNRDAEGFMNDKLIRYRGNYDAKDQDVINARASRVGLDALGDAGHGLISHSYIIVADPYMIEKKVNDQGKVSWNASTKGYAYKLDLSEEELNDFYDKCWIYEDDNTATKDAKRRAFYDYAPRMTAVAVVSSASSGTTVEGAVSSSLRGLVTELENNISDWEVAITIAARKPLRAKIGTKEGLQNKDRYRAYSYSEDREGNLISVPRGYLRATEVADNVGMSSGATDVSEFYQISGLANIDEGWTIKQSNDIGLGVMAGIKFGGLCKTSLSIDADYLINVKTNGMMSYLLFGFGFDLAKTGYFNYNVGAGYAYGIHLSRFFEIAPYAMLLDDYLSASTSATESKTTFLKKSALVLEPGVRATVNVAYPLQIYGKACFDILTLQGQYYRNYNSYVGHKSGFGFQVGAKWTF